MAFYPQTCPLVWGILGETYRAYQVSSQEDSGLHPCNIGESPNHSGRSEGCAEQSSSDPLFNCMDPITPSHLLYGRSIISLPYQ